MKEVELHIQNLLWTPGSNAIWWAFAKLQTGKRRFLNKSDIAFTNWLTMDIEIGRDGSKVGLSL